MRRITTKYVKAGMVTGLNIYDKFGNLLVSRGERLDQESVSSLVENGVPELLVYDERVADILVAPLYSPALEGRLAQAFSALIQQNITGKGISQKYVDDMRVIIYDIVGDISRNFLGDVSLSCHILPQDYMVLQPVKTAALAMAIANAMKFPDDALADIGTAALLKDIGLPVNLIKSGCSSTEANTPKLHEHPADGYSILAEGNLTSQEVADAVLQHHEFWNGSGYPQGLKGEAISQYAQIISIADSFVDLLSTRSNGEKFMPHVAIEYVMANSGDQFSPELVESFVRHVPAYPAGLSVYLNTGELGIISNPNRGFVARPIVRIYYTKEKGSLNEPYDIDLALSQYQRKLIIQVLEYD